MTAASVVDSLAHAIDSPTALAAVAGLIGVIITQRVARASSARQADLDALRLTVTTLSERVATLEERLRAEERRAEEAYQAKVRVDRLLYYAVEYCRDLRSWGEDLADGLMPPPQAPPVPDPLKDMV